MLPLVFAFPALLLVIGIILILVYLWILQRIVRSLDMDVGVIRGDVGRFQNEFNHLQKRFAKLEYVQTMMFGGEDDDDQQPFQSVDVPAPAADPEIVIEEEVEAEPAQGEPEASVQGEPEASPQVEVTEGSEKKSKGRKKALS